MKIAIVTDTNAGFTEKEIEGKDIYILRMPVLINNEVFFEGYTITDDQFYKRMEADDDIKTSQPAPGEVINLWEKLLKDYDQVIHIPMSSGLSASCQTAKTLAEEDFKDKVFVVDNHRISVTLKSSVYDAYNLVKQGKQGAEIKEILEKDGPNSTIYIMVDTLKYLKKGGRITPAAAVIGDFLHLKPVLSIYGQKLDAFSKCLGVKKAKACMIQAIKDDIAKRFNNPSNDELTFGMAYTHDLNAALIFKNEVMKALNLNDVLLDPLSLSVATHIGPGSLAVTVTKKLGK